MDYTFAARPSIVAFAGSIALLVAYLIWLGFYRLYLSPLAQFPGPKLAALSQWYEFYYDVVLPGQYIFQIQTMHKKYGPIIRITPSELHVEDSDYWDELYSRHTRHDKYAVAAQRFGSEKMLFTTPKHDLHVLRRAVLNPMFSKRSIAKLEPFLKERVDLLCKRVLETAESGEILNLVDVFSAFTGDMIMEYCFGFCDNQLGSPGFKSNFHEAMVNLTSFGNLTLQFPFLNPILQSIPDAITEKLAPPLHMVLVLRRDLKAKVLAIMNGEDKRDTSAQYPTIFHELLKSNLPPHEKSLTRLDDEALGTIGAGLTTIAWALVTLSFHLSTNPSILKKLQTELEAAIPDPTITPDLPQLEKLPYLSACIQEGIRLSYGLAARHARVSPDAATKYKAWKIPAGTPVSMTIVDVHHDEHIYPDSRSFIPERWLDNPKTAEGESLSRYFVSFGKGSRSCIGINLAYAEIFHVAAALFRRFEFELFDTDFSDLQLKHDFFLPIPRLDSKGVRVKVTSISA